MILEKLSSTNKPVLKERMNGNYQLIDNIDCTCLPLCYQEAVAALLNSKFAYRLAYKHLQEYFQEHSKDSKFRFRLVSNPYQRFMFDLIEKSKIEPIHVNGDKLKSVQWETILEGMLKAQQNSSVVDTSWFVLNGMEDLICLQEQAYSWKFWRNILIVTCLALAQITVGAIIEIFTVGIGTYAASFFINEGISDLFFVAGSLWSGHMTMGDYWQHKKWRMAISAVTCGVGALWSRGTKLSRIGYKVAGPVHAEGGKKIAQMADRELINSVGAKTVAKETLKRVGCKLIEGAAYGLAQGAVDHVVTNYLHGLCDVLQKTVVADVDELFRDHELNRNILEAFNKIGEEKTGLIINQVTQDCFQQKSLYSTIYAHCTRLYSAVSRGLSEAMRKMAKAGGKTSAASLLRILGNVQTLFKTYNVYDEISKMKKSAATFLKNANKIIQDVLNEQTSSTSTNVHRQQHFQVIRDRTMQQWKQTVVETSNQVIATYVVAPILSHGTNQLVGYLGNTIKKKYRSYKEDQYRTQFETLKKNWDDKIMNDKLKSEEHEKERQDYDQSLLKLLAKTRYTKLFASILRENVPMDMTCIQACTDVISQCMSHMKNIDRNQNFTGICILVENTDGSSYEYRSSENASHTISLTLHNNHFSLTGNANIRTSNNNCLYESLIHQIPQLKTIFTNDKSFREYLSDYIQNDYGLQYTIAQGWHQFSIQKGSYGGALRKEAYSRTARYKEFASITRETFTKIYKEYPNLSSKIRKKS